MIPKCIKNKKKFEDINNSINNAKIFSTQIAKDGQSIKISNFKYGVIFAFRNDSGNNIQCIFFIDTWGDISNFVANGNSSADLIAISRDDEETLTITNNRSNAINVLCLYTSKF